MNSDIRPDKTSPAYLNKSSSGGLLIGFIYILVFMSILSIAIWQSFESKATKTILGSVDERLVVIEEQINIADETNNDSLSDISSSIQFLDKEVRKLWDLSNKKNKVNIAKLSRAILELEKASKELNITSQSSLNNIKSNKQAIRGNELQIIEISQGSQEMEDIQRTIKSLETQLMLIDDSVQALNNYKKQLNQTIGEIQTQISSMNNDNLQIELE
jgi:prefoldin subunit 5